MSDGRSYGKGEVSDTVIADLGIADHAAGPDADPIAELHVSFQHDVDVDEHILAVTHPPSNIEPCRVRDSHPRQQNNQQQQSLPSPHVFLLTRPPSYLFR